MILNAEDAYMDGLNDMIDQEDAWTVIKAYFKQHGLVSQQISSFNRFLEFNVDEIVKEHRFNTIKVEN